MERGAELSVSQNRKSSSPELWTAYMREFAERVLARADEEDVMMIDRTGGETGFLEDALVVACTKPSQYKSELVDLIQSLSFLKKNVLFDPVHRGGLYLDRFGEVLVSLGEEAELDFSGAESSQISVKPSKVLVLTGPQAGQEKTGSDIDIAPQRVVPGVISE